MKHRISAVCLLTFPLLGGALYAQPTLQSQEVMNVNGTADGTVNVTLPFAPAPPPKFSLSGPITGAGALYFSVTARSTDGLSFFAGAVDFGTNNYLVKVPAGTYNLSVSYVASLTAASTISTYNDPTPVQVVADTVRPIVVVPGVVHAVSGTVSALDPRFATTSLVFSPTTANTGFSASVPKLGADGTYATSLSDGTYTAVMVLAAKDFSRLLSLNLGSLTVAGADVVANYTLPALSGLSGIILTADGIPAPTGSSVIGIEGNFTLTQNATALAAFSFGTGTVGDASGSYQMILVNGRQYTVAVSAIVLAEDLPQSAGGFTLILPNTVQLAGDMTQNITLPRLPGTVTISGQVTDPTGAPVANATVEAGTAEVSGVSLGAFSRSTQTDANGNYRLVVLSGTNYDFVFVPPFTIPTGLSQTNRSITGSMNWIKRMQSAIPR